MVDARLTVRFLEKHFSGMAGAPRIFPWAPARQSSEEEK